MHFNFPCGYIRWHYEKSLIYEAPGQSWVLVLKILHLSWLFLQQLRNKKFWCLGLGFLVGFRVLGFFSPGHPMSSRRGTAPAREGVWH